MLEEHREALARIDADRKLWMKTELMVDCQMPSEQAEALVDEYFGEALPLSNGTPLVIRTGGKFAIRLDGKASSWSPWLRGPKVASINVRGCDAPPSPQGHLSPGLAAIIAERARQISVGYDAAHDDKHRGGEIINAVWGAKDRLQAAIERGRAGDVDGYNRYLVEAAAQMAAEVERVLRATATETGR